MKFLVYCDETLPDLFTTTKPIDKRLMINTLHEILESANWNANIQRVQALPSKEVVLIKYR